MQQVFLFGMLVDAVREAEAVERILGWVRNPAGDLRYVVTPNVQHALLFQRRADFRDAYGCASLILPDGAPLVWVSRLLGSQIPERVAGSDLVPALLSAASHDRPLSLYLLGAAPGVGERAARAVRDRFPNVRVVGLESPPLGFEHDVELNRAIVARINAAAPDVLIVGLGAPKQELWTYRHRDSLRIPVALCAGATIDFLAGAKDRAPTWMRKSGLEWLHRVATEPRRLAPRYASDALRFPGLVWREWRELRATQGKRPR